MKKKLFENIGGNMFKLKEVSAQQKNELKKELLDLKNKLEKSNWASDVDKEFVVSLAKYVSGFCNHNSLDEVQYAIRDVFNELGMHNWDAKEYAKDVWPRIEFEPSNPMDGDGSHTHRQSDFD